MTIHSTHPFADAENDPVRRLRGRLGGAVALLTAGGSDRFSWGGLTVTSLMVAAGEQARVLALVDPDSDLADAVADTGYAVISLLTWAERDLADAFAGVAPAPGGVFGLADFVVTSWGPRLTSTTTWAGVRIESTTEVGWSRLLTGVIEELSVSADDDPLLHRRGRYSRSRTDP